jgi:hypothetical protein
LVKIKSKSKSPHGVSPESFTFDKFEREAINRLNQGDGLAGATGILTGLIQRIVNNAEGLPASPFRTDHWTGLTTGKTYGN